MVDHMRALEFIIDAVGGDDRRTESPLPAPAVTPRQANRDLPIDYRLTWTIDARWPNGPYSLSLSLDHRCDATCARDGEQAKSSTSSWGPAHPLKRGTAVRRRASGPVIKEVRRTITDSFQQEG